MLIERACQLWFSWLWGTFRFILTQCWRYLSATCAQNNSMSMDITFLGTGSAYPSPNRGASALVLRTEGESWLFDCGEGTQTQFMRSSLKASQSHTHCSFRSSL